MTPAVTVNSLAFSYGKTKALDGVSFEVPTGSLFSVVGPNGGGKSTLFKVLSTLQRPQTGQVRVFGNDVQENGAAVRSSLGVLFQSPALDKKLSVTENLRCQGHLFGLRGEVLRSRVEELLKRFSLSERAQERVEKLSGGLKRRVEIAKALVSRPKLLLLDEPTTGLDPAARFEVWQYLKQLQKDEGLTVLFTTHLLDEADASDSLVFLSEGKVVLSGEPQSLKSLIGGDILSLRTKDAKKLSQGIWDTFQIKAKTFGDEVRIEKSSGAEFIPKLVGAFVNQIDSVTLGRPTLEDLFIQKTGRRLWQKEAT